MNSVFLILDLQNDLVHPEGVYGRHGLSSAQIPIILPNIVNAMQFCRKNNIPMLATKLTVLVDHNKQAIGLGYYKKLRPFLEKEGFREGTWGHDLLEELPKVDFTMHKWGQSAFYQTELDRYLSALSCEQLILSGFPTNGVIETTAREAVGRNLQIITLTDCVTSYSESLHQASLTNLGAVGQILTSKEWIDRQIQQEPH